MDDVSHALWSYVLFSKTEFWLLAVIIGVLPDVLPFVPSVLHNWSEGKLVGKLRVKNMPRWLQAYVHTMFGITHSLIVSVVVSALVLFAWPGQWWILVWPLHVIIDIFTHAKPEPTPFLWPFSDYGFHGHMWTWKHFIVSSILLVAIWLALHWPLQ